MKNPPPPPPTPTSRLAVKVHMVGLLAAYRAGSEAEFMFGYLWGNWSRISRPGRYRRLRAFITWYQQNYGNMPGARQNTQTQAKPHPYDIAARHTLQIVD